MSVLRSALDTFAIANEVVVALVRSVLPVSVVDASDALVLMVRMLPVSPPLNVLSAEKVLAVVVENAVVKMPVLELYASGYAALSEVEEILLLKVVKSVEER